MKTAHRLICCIGDKPVILTEEVSVVQTTGDWVSIKVNGTEYIDSASNIFETKQEAVAAGIERVTKGLREIHQRYEKVVNASVRSVLDA